MNRPRKPEAERSNPRQLDETMLLLLYRSKARGRKERRDIYQKMAASYAAEARTGSGKSNERALRLRETVERLEAWFAAQGDKSLENAPPAVNSTPGDTVAAREPETVRAEAPPSADSPRIAIDDEAPHPLQEEGDPSPSMFPVLPIVAGTIVIAAIAVMLFFWPGSSSGGRLVFDLATVDGFEVADGNSVEKHPDGYEVRSTALGPPSIGTTGGAYLVLPSTVEQRVSGRTIRVELRAKQLEANASPEMGIAYSTAGVGNSGWRFFRPTDDWREFSFEYGVPVHNGEPGNDYIGIWADFFGKNRGVVVSELRVILLDEQ